MVSVVIIACAICSVICLFLLLRIASETKRSREDALYIRKKLVALEMYICGKDGKFEDSINNGASLNGILNATITEIAKMNPDGWTVSSGNQEDIIVAKETSVAIKESSEDKDKISFSENDFSIEEE